MKDTIRDRITYFAIILMLFAWTALVQDYRSETAQDTARAAQNYTDDVFNLDHVAATNLQNMENNFACLKSSFSGGSAPANPVAGMWWFDTTSNYLKLRNEANSAWLNMYDFANSRAPLALLATNCSRTVLAGTGISVSGNLSSGNVTVGIASGGVGNAQVANAALGAEKFQTGSTENSWVQARTAGAAVGAVGTYALMYSTSDYAPGDTAAGSNLRFAGIGVGGTYMYLETGDAPSGTWRCMGCGISTALGTITLWLRIS